MATIVTITFNPALDKSVSVPELISERKLKCSVPVYEPGGGGINVARAIKKLGGDALALYPGGGYAGTKIGELLNSEGIQSIAVPIEGNTRENLIVTDQAAGKQYLFDMPGPFITAAEWHQCLTELGKLDDVKYIVVSGSMPAGLPGDIFARLNRVAALKNARLIVDTSGEALLQAVKAGAYLIKPNLKELGHLAHEEGLDPTSAVKIARQLISENDLQVVIVSLGSLGAMMVTTDTFILVSPPKIEPKSTVGAGDSLVAGIVHYLSSGKSLQESVQFGVACGSAATLNPGTELCRKADAESIYQSMRKPAPVL
ncbi:MAG: 1-phosphofructokinase family hexose kinase [Bacteroidetes bacterium]|nr:1-phosphofructokinase family hexose kinase [Bacteroidota bacterium]